MGCTAGAIYTMLLAFAFIAEARIVVTPFAKLGVHFPLNQIMTDAILVTNESYRRSLWLLARTLCAIPIFLYGCGLLFPGTF